MKTQKSPDCQHLQFSTHCQFIANNSAKVAWRKMPEKTQYICSILHDHAMTIRWKFTILHQKMRFLTSENMIYGTRWLCFKTDEKKLIRSTWCWKGRCHYWKIGKLPRRQLFFYMLTLKHSWWHRRTSVPSRICWHFIWHSVWHIFWHFMWHSVWLSDIYSDIHFDILNLALHLAF
jgi:hypothetical protein